MQNIWKNYVSMDKLTLLNLLKKEDYINTYTKNQVNPWLQRAQLWSRPCKGEASVLQRCCLALLTCYASDLFCKMLLLQAILYICIRHFILLKLTINYLHTQYADKSMSRHFFRRFLEESHMHVSGFFCLESIPQNRWYLPTYSSVKDPKKSI